MRTRLVCWLASGIVTGALSSCSSTGKLKPCPPKGIGVEDYAGDTAAAQILSYDSYDCREAQICPDLPFAYVKSPFVLGPEARPEQATVGLTNCSNGNKKLVIEKVLLYGDARCAYTCACRRDAKQPCERCAVAVQKHEVNPGETVSVMIEYRPTSAGIDGAAFHVLSNARNFAPLIVPMCAEAVASAPAQSRPDAGGVTPDAAAAGDGGAGSAFIAVCAKVDVSTVNTDCHEP